MRNIQEETNRTEYLKGYESKSEEIRAMGWDEARDKFNFDYPRGSRPLSSGAYYYSQGEIDALADEI